MGPGSSRAQSGFADGFRFSREHRPGHGVVSRSGVLHVRAQAALAMRPVFRSELSGQGRSGVVLTGILFLLDAPAARGGIPGSIRSDFSVVVCRAVASFPRAFH